jgi:hypothetical protein
MPLKHTPGVRSPYTLDPIPRSGWIQYGDTIMSRYLAKSSALLALATLSLATPRALGEDPFVIYPGGEGPGAGKHIVFIAGDEEYRSEEGMPMLARILAIHHGFKCTVLFSMNSEDGTIDPMNQTHIPGMEQLDSADMVVIFTRFRELPDADMKHFVDYVESGKPLFGIRTATHAFDYKRNKESAYRKYTWRNDEWPGGFGITAGDLFQQAGIIFQETGMLFQVFNHFLGGWLSHCTGYL